MNERIQELYDQAFTLGTSGYSNGELDVEKFAELIVRECLEIAIEEEALFKGPVETMIRKRFGVEE